MRRRLKSSFSDVTTKTTSTLAHSTCSSVACQAVLRENFVRRGRTARIVPVPSSRRAATATQSPTTGRSAVVAASWVSLPGTSQRSSPCSASTSQAPRCCTATRPARARSRGAARTPRPAGRPSRALSDRSLGSSPSVSVHESGPARARTVGAEQLADEPPAGGWRLLQRQWASRPPLVENVTSMTHPLVALRVDAIGSRRRFVARDHRRRGER